MALQAAINDHKVHAHLRSILLYAKKRMIYYCNHLSEIFLFKMMGNLCNVVLLQVAYIAH